MRLSCYLFSFATKSYRNNCSNLSQVSAKNYNRLLKTFTFLATTKLRGDHGKRLGFLCHKIASLRLKHLVRGRREADKLTNRISELKTKRRERRGTRTTSIGLHSIPLYLIARRGDPALIKRFAYHKPPSISFFFFFFCSIATIIHLPVKALTVTNSTSLKLTDKQPPGAVDTENSAEASAQNHIMLNPHLSLEGGYATGIIIFATLVVVLSMCVSFVACRFFGPKMSRGDPSEPSAPYIRATAVRMWVRDNFSRKKLSKSWQLRFAKISNAGAQSALTEISSTKNHIPGSEDPRQKGARVNIAYSPIPNSPSHWDDMEIEETSHEIFV